MSSGKYEEAKTMNFGVAVEALKGGKKVAREGWNGKGMYVQLNRGGDYEFSEILPFFVIKNVLNSFNTWVPSISDILAEDWALVGESNQYGDYLKIDGTLEEIGDSVIDETAEIVERKLRDEMDEAAIQVDHFTFERIVKQTWSDGGSWSSEQMPGYLPVVTVGVKATRIKE